MLGCCVWQFGNPILRHFFIDADSPPRVREEWIKQWSLDVPPANLPQVPLIVSTIAVLGTGMNLNRATDLFLMEVGLTLSGVLQGAARIHRLSSKYPCRWFLLRLRGYEPEDLLVARQRARREIKEHALVGNQLSLDLNELWHHIASDTEVWT